jgi:CheY-like chemotaxis protein
MTAEKILLIDDDEDDQFIFKDALREISSAWECITAKNGLEGMQILSLESSFPTIIFLDLNMPIMNGEEFLKMIKQHQKYRSIPIIIFSTSNSPADKQRLLQLGASRFITKTGDFNKLKEKLLEILANPTKNLQLN